MNPYLKEQIEPKAHLGLDPIKVSMIVCTEFQEEIMQIVLWPLKEIGAYNNVLKKKLLSILQIRIKDQKFIKLMKQRADA